MKIEYDGTDFLGWQLQAEGRTVQGAVEQAVQKALGIQMRVPVHASGRTDTGVHAVGQVAHFDTDISRPPITLVDALNHWLPDDVSILAATRVSSSFHSRFSASRKLYRYRILRSSVPHPLRERFTHRVYEDLHPSPMQLCAQRIIGTHNFASFTSSGSSVQSTVRCIHLSEWRERGDELHYFVESNGFTYNMVRALVGTMIEAGRANLSPTDMERIILARDRRYGGPTVSPKGLMLMHVEYDYDLTWD
ncbi:MAG: tRNA pseudouridine(38-40) synthase TruA [Planctomycetota bacterium]